MAHMLQPLLIPRILVPRPVSETIQNTHHGGVITDLREFANQVDHLAGVDAVVVSGLILPQHQLRMHSACPMQLEKDLRGIANFRGDDLLENGS